MASSTAKARKAVLDLIAEVAKVQASTSNVNDKIEVQIHKARSILILSEAHAWLMSPGQTHGSPPTSAK